MDPISIALHFNGCHKRRIHSALHKVITLTQPPRAVGQIAKLVAASAVPRSCAAAGHKHLLPLV